MNNKKGLSTIVTSLILILLVLVAVGVVWIVVRNIISEGAEQVALGKFTIDLEIKKVTVNDGSVDVGVKRNSGAGELSGIKFIIDDGINTQVFEEATTMAELGSNTFTLNYNGLVKEVSIAPILKTESGKEFTGSEINSFEFSNVEMITNMNGLVSWWRFDGDAQDEVGDNDGIINGADCNADGKYNRACEFDGVDDYVEIVDDINFRFSGQDFSWGLWFNAKDFDYQSKVIGFTGSGNSFPWFARFGGNRLSFLLGNGSTVSVISSQLILSTDMWYYYVGTFDATTREIKIYENGVIDNSAISSFNELDTTTQFEVGGSVTNTEYFNGLIDEVMIFNKALSEDEIKVLYEFDLS